VREQSAVRLNRTSVLASEAGLLGLCLILVAFAMFGPLFTYWIGLSLFGTAASLGAAAVAFGHRAAHVHRRDPHLAGRGYATLGSIVGWIALLVSASYVGLLYLLLHPIIVIMALPLGLLGLGLHVDSRARERSFLQSFDVRTDTAACGRCGTRSSFAAGRWGWEGWRCSNCSIAPWGVSG
jgi:hypothetical protein